MLATINAKDAAWKAFIADTTVEEAQWVRAMRRLFRAQRDEVIDNLLQGGEEGKLFFIKIDVDDVLFDYDAAVEAFQEVIDPLMRSTILSGGNAAVERFDLAIDFSIENPRVRAYVRRYGAQLAKTINDTHREAVRRTLAAGLKEGETVQQLAERINQYYQGRRDRGAETIARTEVIRASNFGALESYQQAGVEKKEWLAELDERVRASHAAANGQVKEADEPFDVGGEELMYPGDPAGSAAETINCRCTVLPVVE